MQNRAAEEWRGRHKLPINVNDSKAGYSFVSHVLLFLALLSLRLRLRMDRQQFILKKLY